MPRYVIHRPSDPTSQYRLPIDIEFHTYYYFASHLFDLEYKLSILCTMLCLFLSNTCWIESKTWRSDLTGTREDIGK